MDGGGKVKKVKVAELLGNWKKNPGRGVGGRGEKAAELV